MKRGSSTDRIINSKIKGDIKLNVSRYPIKMNNETKQLVTMGGIFDIQPNSEEKHSEIMINKYKHKKQDTSGKLKPKLENKVMNDKFKRDNSILIDRLQKEQSNTNSKALVHSHIKLSKRASRKRLFTAHNKQREYFTQKTHKFKNPDINKKVIVNFKIPSRGQLEFKLGGTKHSRSNSSKIELKNKDNTRHYLASDLIHIQNTYSSIDPIVKIR